MSTKVGVAVLAWALACVCGRVGGAKYTWGDALTDLHAPGPDGIPYPNDLINRMYAEGEFGPPSGLRRGRTLHHTLDPEAVRRRLLEGVYRADSGDSRTEHGRGMKDEAGGPGRAVSSKPLEANLLRTSTSVKTSVSSSAASSSSSSASTPSCPPGPPARLCQTRYNTTAPMYGVSLTSGQPVTIVQKFPDLLQQVIFEVCESDTCDIVQGSCMQTYVPYLFLVIPLGPVTLTGQDYVLVESGCVCKPKYSQASSLPSPIDAISGANNS